MGESVAGVTGATRVITWLSSMYISIRWERSDGEA